VRFGTRSGGTIASFRCLVLSHILQEKDRNAKIGSSPEGGYLKKRHLLILAFLVQISVVYAAWSADSALPKLRPYEVRDTVELANFTVPPTFSPDGRYFITVTERGVLPKGVTEATIWLFETAAVRQSISGGPTVRAIPIARASAAVNYHTVISELTWEQSGNSLLFLACDLRGNRRLIRLRLRDHVEFPLTPAKQDVADYAASGSHIVYFAAPDTAPERLWWSNDPGAPDMITADGQPLMQLLFPNFQDSERMMPRRFEVWQVHGTVARPVIESTTGKTMEVLGNYNTGFMSLSRDGARVVAIVHADYIPALWAQYEVPKIPDVRPFQPDSVNDSKASAARGGSAGGIRALQYQILDLNSGTRRALLDAPLADSQRGGQDALQAAWSADGRYVAVSGTYLPIGAREGVPKSTGVCGAAVVDTSTGDVDCLQGHQSAKLSAVSSLDWNGLGRLVIEGSGFPAAVYKRDSSKWQLTDQKPEAHRPPLDLAVHQSLNEPPVLTVSDGSGRSYSLLDPNPQLAAIELGTVSVYRWKDSHGRDIQGGLAKPPDFVSGHRYPLVIQTHNFRPRRFFSAGTALTATAGRALTARGMLVLQVDEPEPTLDWEESQQNGLDVYLAAIDKLAAEGFIDPNRVGITGYSRAGTYVAKSITEAPARFAAAVLANTDAATMTAYEIYVDAFFPDLAGEDAEFMAGAKPYGSGLQKWLDRAPGFHTDKVRAPVLISVGGPTYLMMLWGFYSALRDQAKPVELQYFRSGDHNFRKPLQILAHEEMLVDWFDFWLNAHEDPAPGKAAQYARWRRLRGMGERTPSMAAP
jgi:dienelactone hydrolase